MAQNEKSAVTLLAWYRCATDPGPGKRGCKFQCLHWRQQRLVKRWWKPTSPPFRPSRLPRSSTSTGSSTSRRSRTSVEHREIIYTLAERDFRAQYKQAILGILWAVLSPVADAGHPGRGRFSRVKSFSDQGVPYALYAFVGHPVLEFLLPLHSATVGARCSTTKRCWPRRSSPVSAFRWRPWASSA